MQCLRIPSPPRITQLGDIISHSSVHCSHPPPAPKAVHVKWHTRSDNNWTHDAATSRCPPAQNIYTHAQKHGPCSTLLAYSLCRCYSKSNWSILLLRQGPQQAIQAHNTPAPLHPVHRCKRSSHNHQIPHPPHHQHNDTALRPLQCKPLPRANHVHPGTKFFSHPSPVYSISQMHRPL